MRNLIAFQVDHLSSHVDIDDSTQNQ